MLDTSSLSLFVAASIALLVFPGPAVLFIVARSIEHGRTAGIVSVLGIAAGAVVHVTAAALGLSALLVSSATAFTVVKWAGAIYLVWLGIRTLRGNGEPTEAGDEQRSLPEIFRQGVVVNILNPKTAAFFFAFLPQFVSVDRGSVAVQIMLLGALFVGLAIVSDGVYAVAAGTLGDRLKQRPGLFRTQRIVAGSTYLLLGVGTALTGSRK